MLEKESARLTKLPKRATAARARVVKDKGGCAEGCMLESMIASNPVHPDHSRNLNRIRRAQGQLDGVASMIIDRRYCPEILQQIRAAGAAVKALEAAVLELHFRGCIRGAAASKNPRELDQKLEEMLKLFIRD